MGRDVAPTVTHPVDKRHRMSSVSTGALPQLTNIGRTGDAASTRLVVLVLPGGRARSHRAARPVRLADLRMRPFGRVALAAGRAALPAAAGVAVFQLVYRLRGWNEPDRDPVRDAEWALEQFRGRYPTAAVVLVGHSMGGRTALYVAGAPAVRGVCALAPWIEQGDPVAQLAGRSLVIAHGDRDRITDPALSRRYVAQAGGHGADARWVPMPGTPDLFVRRSSSFQRESAAPLANS